MLKTIIPENKEHWLEMRRKVLTSTEIAALFNVSPYLTPFELFYRKHNNIEVEFEPSERVKWGSRLEESVARGVAEDNNWKIRKMDEFIFDDVLRVGASFDYSIESQPMGILEIKCVDNLKFKNDWIVDGDNIESSPQIELQVQTQLLVSDRSFAWIAALIGGNKVVLIKRTPDAAIHAAIKQKAAAFWSSIESNQEPKPDFIQDADFISKLYGYAQPNKVLDATTNIKLDELMKLYRKYQQEEKKYGEFKDAAKAEALTIIGDAEKVLGEGWSISAGLIGEAEISFTRKPFRNFRPTFKKDKI